MAPSPAHDLLDGFHRRLTVLRDFNKKAHQLNGNMAGIYEEIAETWAIMLGIPAMLPLSWCAFVLCSTRESFRKCSSSGMETRYVFPACRYTFPNTSTPMPSRN